MFFLSSLSNYSLRIELYELIKDLGNHYKKLQFQGAYGYKMELYQWKVARFVALQSFANAHLNVTFMEQEQRNRANSNRRWRANQRNNFKCPPKANEKRKRNKKKAPNNAAKSTSNPLNITQKAMASNKNVVKPAKEGDSNEHFGNISNIPIKQEINDDSNQHFGNISNIPIKQEKQDDCNQHFGNISNIPIKQEKQDNSNHHFGDISNIPIKQEKQDDSNQHLGNISNIPIKQEKHDDSNEHFGNISNIPIKQETYSDSNQHSGNISNTVIKGENVDDGYQNFFEFVNSIQRAKVGNKRKCTTDARNTKKSKVQ